MKTVLAISLIALALLGAPAADLAAETGAAATEPPVVPDGEPAPPHANGEQADAPDQAVPDEDIMQNFTRHRPGACPEGPPCKVED
jgi:hypothetical protein